ncbi:hypothetical protein FHP05_07075 [Cerasibacillus terrae]|uniref:Uncharacterized protein n=1 Tax=Cerasibacillus terrae TaxID=2498845 RepID=A0A5C8NXC2_9BACI|nr:hypothetical protein FHP05_07075 [Cerasibacillus terrae]
MCGLYIKYCLSRINWLEDLHIKNSRYSRIIKGGSAASKSPIRSTNNQWEKKKLPLIEVSLYYPSL